MSATRALARIAMSRTRLPQSFAMPSTSEVSMATGPGRRSTVSATVAHQRA
ncbi:hypothetical protein [Kitasatospora sp. NPDC001175]|uniref:hypothetical protein n=1 Tax=Kitasatospora sp. NPDC001175 TaxID=3157103 RepID=UPI003CFC37B9